MSVSTSLIGFINVVTAIISIPIIATGYVLYKHGDVDCDRLLLTPFAAVGVLLLVVSIFGLVGACCRSAALMWIYLFLMLVAIAVLCSFMAFAFTLTTTTAEHTNLDEYSRWVRQVVNDRASWDRIKSCLKRFNVCPAMYNPSFLKDIRLFYDKAFAPIQSGCCMPPAECGYVHKGTFAWSAPETAGLSFPSSNGDCKLWSNSEESLCYMCDSCKAGFLDNLDHLLWKRMAIYSTLLLFLLILVYSVGCCALGDTRHRHYGRYGHVPY